MLGKLLVVLMFILSWVTMWLYFRAIKNQNNYLKVARNLFLVLNAGSFLTVFLFIANVLSRDYQYTYIWENSSNYLPGYLQLSSFYAGQEGSFLLWLLFLSIIGFFLAFKLRDNEFEKPAIGFYISIMSFVLLMLVFKNPFEYIWETYKEKGLAVGFTPTNGKGLNPILENIWMAIHPPVLFLGYSAMAVPFVFALSGLILGKYNQWTKYAYPWILFSASILGTGIILGGFWAYETLGWGGFWGWDPVENSSLMPWLFSIVIMHTIIIQQKVNGLAKTNIALTIFSFILVLYATYLTRSGVLGDTSVHSFTNPGNTIQLILVLFLVLFFAISVYYFIKNSKKIKSTSLSMKFSAREFLLALGAMFILLSAIVIFVGTSFPLISEYVGKKASVAISFYNQINLPLAVLMLLSNAISLFTSWKSSDVNIIKKRVIIPTVLTILIFIVSLIFSQVNILYHILIISAIFSSIVNIEFAIRTLSKRNLKIGGYLSHLGFSLLMIGALSSVFSYSNHFRIKEGERKNISGYNIHFIDKVQIQKEMPDRQKFIYRFGVEKGTSNYIIDPIVSWNDFNQKQQPILEPGIKSFLFEDVYFTLKSAEVLDNYKSATIIKDSTINCDLDSNIKITLTGYDMAHKMLVNTNKPMLGAIMNYSDNGKNSTDTIFTKMGESSVYQDVFWRKIPGTSYDIAFWSFLPSKENMARSEANLIFKLSSEPYKKPIEIITAEISIKPLMNFVWVGAILMLFGTMLSILVRFRKTNID